MATPAAEHPLPGPTVPVVDHGRCEAKRACVAACPTAVFEVRRIGQATSTRSPCWAGSRSGPTDG